MTTRWARFTRGWVAAALSTFVAALSHALGGGHAPGMVGLVVSLAFAGIICVALAGRTLSWLRLSVSVVLSQLTFHTLFSVGAPGGALSVPAGTGSAAHVHGAHPLVGFLGHSEAIGGAHAAHGGQMWLAHAAAACVTIVALRRGETTLWRLLDLVRLVIRSLRVALPGLAPVTSRAGARIAERRVGRRDARLVFSAMRHRGPPALVARAS